MSDQHRSILEYLDQQNGRPVHIVELMKHLRLRKSEGSELRRLLRKMAKSGLVVRGKNRTYRKAVRVQVTGALSIARDGYGFVAVDGGEGPDVFIPARDLHGACHGDKVCAEITDEARGRRVGMVVDVLSRKHARVTGILKEGRSGVYVAASYGGNPIQVYLEEYTSEPVGSSVGIVLTKYPVDSRDDYVGYVEETFDEKARVTTEIDRTVYQRNLPLAFPDDVMAEANALPDEIREEDKAGREDWTELPFVTIDGADARDFDDAVCLVPKGKGIRLYVAVADVSHYVREGTALDREALERGTSVYFPDRVLPMLPEKLSNGLCSLNPHVERLVEASWFDFDASGKIVKTGLAEAVIRSHARLTYDQVQRLLDGSQEDLPPTEYHEMIRRIAEVATGLFEARKRKGALDLEVPEAGFSISEDGAEVESVSSRTRTNATGLIEECMLLANRTVAEAFIRRAIPSMFRIHEDPDPDKIAAFFRMAGVSGSVAGEKVDGNQIASALQVVSEPSRRQVLQGLLLRALQKARYGPECLGHFGLAFEAYLHFTSPIRRYPDLVVHRLVRQYLLDDSKHPSNPEKLAEALGEIARQCSTLERRALESERDIHDALKARYMEDRVGDEFDGVITSMIARGFFIRLGDYPIDGFLRDDALPDANFAFDPERMWFLNGATGERIRLGQTIRVQLVRSSMEERRIDLDLTEWGLAAPPEESDGSDD